MPSPKLKILLWSTEEDIKHQGTLIMIFFLEVFFFWRGRGGARKFFKVHSMSILAICSNQRKETVPIAKLLRINKTGLLLACVANVSHVFVWFRSKKRPRNGIFGFGRARNETRAKKMKEGRGGGEGRFLSSPPPPRSFTCAIFRAVSDSRSSFFNPKPHGNACYAG